MGGFDSGGAWAASLVVAVGGTVYTVMEYFMFGRLAAVIACIGFFTGVFVSAKARRFL